MPPAFSQASQPLLHIRGIIGNSGDKTKTKRMGKNGLGKGKKNGCREN
jgi:hypothetical protein